jgi:hypothetical protein
MCFYDEKTKTLQDPWCVDDVLQQRPDLTEAQACEVLAFMADKFDANIGINWDVIDSAAEYLFPQKDSCLECGVEIIEGGCWGYCVPCAEKLPEENE